jgi:hypothetical protein
LEFGFLARVAFLSDIALIGRQIVGCLKDRVDLTADIYSPSTQHQITIINMAPVGGGAAEFEAAAMARRKALAGASGPMALIKNLKVFGIACFACLGGLLYGYNQGVFSGVLTMTSFKERKSTKDTTFLLKILTIT